jgi:CheY-like chemotaxis protein
VKYYREVRDDETLRDIPIVMVTGVSKDFEHFISTRKQVPPPDAYLAKPVDQAELLKTVAQLLKV